MYWFKPLTFACHRIPEKNGHIKVITSAYATLTCPFSPGMGWSSNPKRLCRHITAALVSILLVIAFIILTRPIHACSHYSFRSAANKVGRAGNWILEFSAYPGVCILSTRVRMWRMLIRHRRTRVSESKQTTDMWKCKNSIPRTPGLFISSVSILLYVTSAAQTASTLFPRFSLVSDRFCSLPA